MSQYISSPNLGGSADLMSAPYSTLEDSLNDWLDSSCDATSFFDFGPKQLCPTGQSMPTAHDDMTLATATEDASLPLLLSPDELHPSWAIDGASSRTSPLTMDFNSTGRIPSVPPSPVALPQLQCSAVSGDAETSSDTDSITTDATAQVRRRSTDCSNHRHSSGFRKSKSHHYTAERDKTVGRNALPPTKRKTGRLPHNEVEKRYRNSLNFELRRLQMAVPYLANSDQCRGPSPTKATIIASAVQYIKAIEAERDALRVGVGATKVI